jgi:cytosine/creatinine deaminase
MASTMRNLILKNVRPMGGPADDVLVEQGIIKSIGGSQTAPPGYPVIDGQGHLLLPGFVEGHVHLDKILWGLPYQPVQAGPEILDYIENEKRIRLHELKVPVDIRAGNLIRQCVRKGTAAIRSHVDIDPDYGLSNLEGVLAAKEKYASVVDIQIVAFPQSGVIRMPGTIELLEEAMNSGADHIGGLDPLVVDKDPAGQLNALFRIAHKHGCSIDIHLHDPGELGAFTIDMMIDRVEALGMQGKVVISHGWCLGQIEYERFQPLTERMARNGVSVLTSAPGARTMPPIAKLRANGVTVFAASDSLRDTWNPYGNGDMLERTMLVGWRSNFRRDEEIMVALDTTTYAGAKILGLEKYGLAPGCKADFFTLPGESVPEAIMTRPERSLVVKAGRVVAQEGVYEGPGAE